MSTYTLNPLADARWPDFLRRHPDASVFHSPEWLDALNRTYGYDPVVYTTTPPGTELKNGWAFCRVNSWLTGRRLVSLPFSDHCDPLVDEQEDLDCLARGFQDEQQKQGRKYVEIRPRVLLSPVPRGFQGSQTFCLHTLDLQPDTSEIFSSLHKDSTQRKIRRAEREGLTCEEGRSEELLEKFYQLLLLTRRRHRVPPQPRGWFTQLATCLGDRVKIHVAARQGQPVASILTLRFNGTLVYKYGGSDVRFQNLGGMHLCLWRAIEGAKAAGLRVLDLGRSDPEDEGLITFKSRWGARSCTLTYFRQCVNAAPGVRMSNWQTPRARKILEYVPGNLMSIGGRLLYRHLG